MCWPEERWPLIDEALDWVWTETERAGLPVMLLMNPGQLHLADRIAARHPGLKLVMDHLARHYGKKDDEAFADLDKLLALAKRPNIAVKASGMPAYASDDYPYRRVHSAVRRAWDAFGPRCVFWGTDLTKLQCTYRQAVTMFTEELPWLTAADQEWIMGRALCEWLGCHCLGVKALPGVAIQRVAAAVAVACPASRLGMKTMRQLATTIVPARK